MGGDETKLQPLLAHLYGPGLARVVARLVDAHEGERMIVLGSDATAPTGWTMQEDEAHREEPLETEGRDPFPVIDFHTWRGPDEFAAQIRENGMWCRHLMDFLS